MAFLPGNLVAPFFERISVVCVLGDRGGGGRRKERANQLATHAMNTPLFSRLTLPMATNKSVPAGLSIVPSKNVT